MMNAWLLRLAVPVVLSYLLMLQHVGGTVCTQKADIVVALDYSDIKWSDWQWVVAAVIHIVNAFEIGPSNTQIGLLTFNSHQTRVEFNLNDYDNQKSTYDAVVRLANSTGSGQPDFAAAFQKATEEVFLPANGARPDACKFLIFVSHTRRPCSVSGQQIVSAATAAKAAGIKVFLLGVTPITQCLTEDVLQQINSNTEWTVYGAKGHKKLWEFVRPLADAVCGTQCAVVTTPVEPGPNATTATIPTTTTTPATTKSGMGVGGTGCTQKADIVVALDYSDITWSDWQWVVAAVIHIVNAFEIGPSNTQIGLLTFNSQQTRVEFNLNDYDNQKSTYDAVVRLANSTGSGQPDFAAAFQKATEETFLPANGARPDACKFLIFVSHTKRPCSVSGQQIVSAATAAKEAGIKVFLLGVTRNSQCLTEDVLQQINSNTEWTVYEAKGHKNLWEFVRPLADAVCGTQCAVVTTPVEPGPNATTATIPTTATTTTTPATTKSGMGVGDTECTQQADIVVALDNSDIASSHWQWVVASVLRIVKEFEIGPNKTHIGLLTFNDRTRVEFNLNDYHNETTVNDAVLKLANITHSGEPDFAAAFQKAREDMFSSARSDVCKVLIMVSHFWGPCNGSEDQILSEATATRAAGIKVALLGINGLCMTDDMMVKIASEPAAFGASWYAYLSSFAKPLTDAVCGTLCAADATKTTTPVSMGNNATTTRPTTTTTTTLATNTTSTVNAVGGTSAAPDRMNQTTTTISP